MYLRIHILFLFKKIEQAANPTLPTNFCYSLVFVFFSFCICWYCSNCCCSMMFFSLSAMYLSAKCKIKSAVFKKYPLFPPFRKGWPFFCVRLHIYYYILTIKSSEFHKENKKMFSYIILIRYP